MAVGPRPPLPYFGGKARIAGEIWRRFGNPANFIDPFAGSLAVLLARPHPPAQRGIETANDADGLLSNFWRSVQYDPEAVAHWADWIIAECDLHSRHLWLLGQRERITTQLMADPDYYDAKAAGWWVWGICQWIGSGWCQGNGAWTAERFLAEAEGKAAGAVPVALPAEGDAGRGIHRQLPHLGDAGMGIHRKLPHLGDAGMGIHRKLPHLGNAGMGIHRKLPHLGNAGMGAPDGECAQWTAHLIEMMRGLADRLRRVRVCCGDWTRVLGPAPTTKLGTTAVLLDPPYALAERQGGLYAYDGDLSAAVREWAVTHGDDPQLRIALCGYQGEHEMPPAWEALPWKAKGGYGSQAAEGRGRANALRETVWFSPACAAVFRAERLPLPLEFFAP